MQRAVPDLKRLAAIESETVQINEAIRERGYVLPEPMEVHRAAYLPTMSYDELKAMEGGVIEEKGFTSTMVGEPVRSATQRLRRPRETGKHRPAVRHGCGAARPRR